jgi:hypothetical protein
MFGIFGRRAKQPPLTEFCTWLSEPANLLRAANDMAAKAKAMADDRLPAALRADLLYMVIMGAAGKFDLRGDAQKEKLEGWEELRHYFRDTNLDVITAEAIVWIHFLMGRLFVGDQKKDRETGKSDYTMERVGIGTFRLAVQSTFAMIEAKTGVNFKETRIERGKMYHEALDRGVSFIEPFASAVLGSVGRRLLTDPVKNFARLPLLEQPQEWTPLCAYVGIFCTTIPPGYYETFKEGINQLIDRGM